MKDEQGFADRMNSILKLTGTESFSTGIVFLSYEPKEDAGGS